MAKVRPTTPHPIGRKSAGSHAFGGHSVSKPSHIVGIARSRNRHDIWLAKHSPKPSQIQDGLLAKATYIHDALGNLFPIGTSFIALHAALTQIVAVRKSRQHVQSAYVVLDSIGALISPDVFPVVMGTGMQVNLKQATSAKRTRVATVCSDAWVTHWNNGDFQTTWGAGFFGLPARIFSISVYAGVPNARIHKPL